MDTALTSQPSDQYPIWDAFLQRWPLDSLPNLSLKDYTTAGSQDTFSYWLESRTEKLGSIWGGSAFKFGVFSRKDTAEPEGSNPKYVYAADYAWRSNAGATADAAFARVKDAIVRIAGSARSGHIDDIHDDVLWPIVVWKTAFLYQDRERPTILPVFRSSELHAFVGDVGRNEKIPDLQRRVMASRGQKDLLDFAKEVWTTAQDRLGTTPLTQDAALAFLTERFESTRTPVQSAAGFKTDGGRPLALDRQTPTVTVFLEPCEPDIDGVEVTKSYTPTEPRQSNISDQVPELAVGFPAIKVRVATVGALTKLAEYYDADHGHRPGPGLRTPDLRSMPLEPLNQILYGPPGTGKTYATVEKALAVLDSEYLKAHSTERAALKERFDELMRSGHIRFVTFHQSFSYEDFVEGLRAETDERGQIRYYVADGIFKALCSVARSKAAVIAGAPQDVSNRRIWKMSLGAADTEAHIFQECIERNIALLGWGGSIDFSGCDDLEQILQRFHSQGRSEVKAGDYEVRSVTTFKNAVRIGDLLVVSDGNSKFRAIGEVSSAYRYLKRDEDSYSQCRDVRWLRTYSPSLPVEELLDKRFSQMTLYELSNSLNRDRLASLLGAQPFQVGDTFGGGYIVSEVTPEILWLTKPNGSPLPLVRRILDTLVELVKQQKIALSDIRERKVFERLPDLQLEKYLVNGYESITAAVVERILPGKRRNTMTEGRAIPNARVLIIDEINRGNVSRVLGELITLIEPSKRLGAPEALQVILPYSNEAFGVPDNIYIIGTMNTADRSLATLDLALRRRFVFEEVSPNPSLLAGVTIGGVDIAEMMSTMNERIEVLLDRDHRLGHTYFLQLLDDPSLATLSRIFRSQIMPLLQEYFFEDWERIRLVLNDSRKHRADCFIVSAGRSASSLFGDEALTPSGGPGWDLNYAAFDRIGAYRGIARVQE